MYAKDEGRKWMVIVICEETETTQKKIKIKNQEKLIF